MKKSSSHRRKLPRWTCPICTMAEAIKDRACKPCGKWLDRIDAMSAQQLLRYSFRADRMQLRVTLLQEAPKYLRNYAQRGRKTAA